MFDMSHLTMLSDALEQSLLDKDVEEIQRLCEENDGFIHTIQPIKDDQEATKKIKDFILIHQAANQFIKDVHAEMQKQLFLSTKTRKGVSQYKGIKNAK